MTKNTNKLLIVLLLLATFILVLLLMIRSLTPSPSKPIDVNVTPTPTKVELTETPTPTTEEKIDITQWSRYVNTKYGYSFNYPNFWEYNKTQANLSEKELQQSDKVNFFKIPNHANDPGIGFSVDVNKNGSDLKNCTDLSRCISTIVLKFPQKTEVEKKYFLGNMAIMYTYEIKNKIYSQTFSSLFFMAKGNLYEVSTSSETEVLPTNKKVFNAILDSFTLTK